MQSEPALNSAPAKRVADRYTLIERLGAGGAGVVYRARDEARHRIVAFKQLDTRSAGDRRKTLEALFEREYHTLVRLKHPQIVEVYDYGVTQEGPYYTMQLLDGTDLGKASRLSYEDVCRHLRDVASSLALLHAQRLVHRDVSPSNIRVLPDGTARLLDFGAVASFGTSSEVIGTPSFMAPEVLYQLPLDPRTDLYSLGAVGYFCLTGRAPFMARSAHELPAAWEKPPVAPSVHVPGIPAELDRLLLSMLSKDPLGRPQTDAAVIDQLTVIGRLPPDAHELAEQSYFVSSPIVGRDTQLDWLRARIDQLVTGKGGEVVVEGPPGIGKTRLANELCLAGTVKGTVSLRADAESTNAKLGTALALASRLIEACPDIARRTAEPHRALLCALAPELSEALGSASTDTAISDPAELRLHGHAALIRWFVSVSRERPLLVCVDNIDAADADSASFVAALGRESSTAPLLVLTTLRTGSGARPSNHVVRMMRERAHRLKLSALQPDACEALAHGLFGGAAHASRVGRLLCAQSGGVPRQFMELAQLMVQKNIAKYQAGSWVLPLQVAEHELPVRADEIAAVRLDGLSQEAVLLAEALAVHEGSVPLPVVLAVSPTLREGRLYFLLDELLAEQVLVTAGDGYRFFHEGLRKAVLSRMSSDARRDNRIRAAEALLAFEGSGVSGRVQAALHLVEAGEVQRGTGILVSAARDFAAGAGSHENPDGLVRALCRLVRSYDAEGRSDYELAALLLPLMPLAYYSAEWQFIIEYGERAIDIGIRITGLQRAWQLAAELGPAEAMKQGLASAAAAFAEHSMEGYGSDLKSAISATIGIVPACVGVYGACFNTEAVWRIANAVAPLKLFGEAHVAHAMYLFANADALILGRESESRSLWERALSHFESPQFVAALGERRANALTGGTLFMLGVLDVYRLEERALADAERMENLGIKAWAVTADQVRVLYHSLRGELSTAKTYLDRVELYAVQGAQSWQSEVFWPALLVHADALSGDVMAVRRRSVQLERRCQEIPTLKPYAEAARATYLLLRGQLTEAIAVYEKWLPSFPIKKVVAWETTRAHFARALNAAGLHERAKAVAEEVVCNMLPEDHEYPGRFMEAQRQLALAESCLGNHSRAAALLDELLQKHGQASNDLFVGLLHQARAVVSEREGDLATAQAQWAEMERRFRRTENPSLIAQCERLSITARTSYVDCKPLVASDASLQTAIELLTQNTRVRNAYVYVRTPTELQLAWSSTNERPPVECTAELARWLDVLNDNRRSTVTREGDDATMFETTISGHCLVALHNPAEGTFVGGLVLQAMPGLDLANYYKIIGTLGELLAPYGADALGFLTE